MPSLQSDQGPRDVPLQLRPGRKAGGNRAITSKTDETVVDNGQDNERPKLEFVTTTGPPSERTKQSRYVVRSHAMQAFLQEKKGEVKSRAKPNADLEDKNIGDLKGRFKLATWSRKSTKKSTKEIVPVRDSKSFGVQPSNRDRKRAWFTAEDLLSLNLLSTDVLKNNQIVRDSLDGYSSLPMALKSHTKRFLYHCKSLSPSLSILSG
jgi:hypothetical protein